MSVALGNAAWVGLGEESTWGTPVAASKFIEISEEGIKLNQKPLYKNVLGSPSQRYQVKGKRAVAGNFKAPLIFQGQELILKHLMGSVGSAQIGSTGVYTHTFSLATALPVGLTVIVNRDAASVGGSSCFQYDGCQVNKCTFSQELEDYIGLDTEIEGREESLIAIPTPSFPTFKGVSYDQVTTLTIGGVAIPASMIELTVENGLATDRHKLGTRLRKGIGRSAIRKVTGKLSLEFEDLTLYNFFRSLDTAGALSAIWTGGIAAGSTPYRFAIAAPSVILEGETPPAKDPGPITLEMPFSLPLAAGGASNSELILYLDNLATSV